MTNVTDEYLANVLETCERARKKGYTPNGHQTVGEILARDLVAVRAGIRRLAEFVPYDSELRQDMLRLIGAEMVDSPERRSTHDRR